MRLSEGLLLGMVLTFASAAAGAAGGASGQDVFCEGTYALCIKAPCSPVPTLERLGNYEIENALCACDVVKGWSMGPGACEDRAPVEQNGRTFLISAYSNLYDDKEKTLFCQDSQTVWAWCYGAPCVMDEKNPGKAVCRCPVQTGPAKTLGGNCRQDACKSLWSAATPAGNAFAADQFYRTMQKDHPNVPAEPPAPACGVTAEP